MLLQLKWGSSKEASDDLVNTLKMYVYVLGKEKIKVNQGWNKQDFSNLQIQTFDKYAGLEY